MTCRCGYTGEGEHPCHGAGYSCRRPATKRLVAYPTCLAGAQLKLAATETWACEACWSVYAAARLAMAEA